MVNETSWNWGLKAGAFYGGLGLPVVVGIWLLIPETAGQVTRSDYRRMCVKFCELTRKASRSAAELEELFERKIKPWLFHKTETATQRMVALNATRVSFIWYLY
jgi:hypothetical protein